MSFRIIQHRANNPCVEAMSNFAEIDVQVAPGGTILVYHDIFDVKFPADEFLKMSKFDKFFVDIKQNLSMEKLQEIARLFQNRTLGFFDVPFPSAYYARKAHHVVWARFSEFEPLNRLFDRFWVDPLASQRPNRFLSLMGQTDKRHKMIIASPELHGGNLDVAKDVWDRLRFFMSDKVKVGGVISGLVTKYPREAKEFFSG